jgi:hypothetical protein
MDGYLGLGNVTATITNQFYIQYGSTSTVLNSIQTSYIPQGGQWYNKLDLFMASIADDPGRLFNNIFGEVGLETKLMYILFFALLMMFIVVIFKR